MDAIKLNPCPKCQSDFVVFEEFNLDPRVYLRCCHCGYKQRIQPSKQKAVEEWNTHPNK